MIKALILAAALTGATAVSAVTLDNTASLPGSVSPYGFDGSTTYGVTFTAPVTGTLTGFSLYSNGGGFDSVGYIGDWNGTAAFGFGFGATSILYQSSAFTLGSINSFTTNVAVTAGQNYVAFLSVAGLTGSGSVSWPVSAVSVPGLNYFVWDNGTTPGDITDGDWNYFFESSPTGVILNFAAVPEPATWAMLIAGFGLVGASLRRRRVAAAQ
ncbi:PEPxxWA-CTERM sorting domain-containing protein [Sandaracinobacteroides saxicola]|uniref:PEPxxWA-CTERM sorting domain-containing protein n=1 Tax=Sandaracinobacteroides saxicola TaxID=2759707 RepID=UPI001FB18AB8|nr:PEPxxWA-CTERM sorting domain-containing protein [Sandaracinobacteroides saxicola]